jgi:hypothetical protein
VKIATGAGAALASLFLIAGSSSLYQVVAKSSG